MTRKHTHTHTHKAAPYTARQHWATITINPFNTGTHFYLEICVRLEHFNDIRKGLWRSED
ncbi:hypothetical protein E2C01_059002 [Portunus trituberculatus]|uniref:Uncharacterized protein n=1 Tax=Portunus trituberculatus TaxID=210409 RepID=A0A5B7GXX6_PORTR|nr:hypothetical protein [Portunus trituberculatus]